MKLRHNKKRNVAFLYECLIQELTKSIVKHDDERRAKIVEILKDHFSKESMLRKELDLYRCLYETRDIDPYAAEKILLEAKKEYGKIDKESLFKEQTSLINKINKSLSKDVYFNFISNYKDMATIQQIFNSSVPIKTKVLLEHNLIYKISNKKEKKEEEMKPIDNLAYKTFINKFNEKYSDDLLEEQKELLSRYITSFSDNGVNLKSFINKEIKRLKEQIKVSNGTISGEGTLEKINQVVELLENFKNKEIDASTLQRILKIQRLAEELK